MVKCKYLKVDNLEDITFNWDITLNLMIFDNNPALQVVGLQTIFSSAWVVGESLENIWDAFRRCWSPIFTGYPYIMRVYQEPLFTTPKFGAMVHSFGIKIKLSGCRSHNFLAAGEKYHGRLRTTYQEIRYSYPRFPASTQQGAAVKTMNYIMHEDGLDASLLVLGALLLFPFANYPFPAWKERIDELCTARREMETYLCQLRLITSLNSHFALLIRTSFQLETRY